MAKLSGLLRSAFAEPDMHAVLDADLRTRQTPALRIEGPAALRPFLAAALAEDRTVLAVTATDREADDLGAAAADLLGADAVAVLPELGDAAARAALAAPGHRRARGCRSSAGWPTRRPRPGCVVAAARSLIQPIAPGLGALDPVAPGASATPHDFDALLERLVELAYTRVEMVTARGEFAVRGGIVDIFPPTAEHPVRVEFWGDEVSELRSFAVADQRSRRAGRRAAAPPAAGSCCSPTPVRERAAALARTPREQPAAARAAGAPGRGHPDRGHGVADPGAGRRASWSCSPTCCRPARWCCSPTRSGSAPAAPTSCAPARSSWRPRLVRRGHGRRPAPDRRRRVGLPRPRPTCSSTPPAPAARCVTLSPLITGRDDALAPAVHEVEAYRGDIDRALVDLRAHVATGGTAVLVVGGHGTAQRALEQLREADVPAELRRAS